VARALEEQHAARLEEHAAQGFEAFLTADPEAGGRVDRIADAKAFRWPAIPIELFNHVSGLGSQGIPDEAIINSILDLYRTERLPGLIQLSPLVDTELIGEMLARLGLRKHPGWCILAVTSQTAKPAPIPTPVSIEAVTDETVEVFVATAVKAFTMPQVIERGMRNMVSMVGIDCFLARYDGVPAGVGMLMTRGGVAGLWTGGVLEEFRRRGLHAALISARIQRAFDKGIDLLFSATEDTTGQSTRDLERQGFFTAYELVNWHMEGQSV